MVGAAGILFVIGIHYVATSVGGFFAFTNWTGIGAFELIGLDNFTRIFQDPTKIGALWNTLFLAFGSVILSNILGLASPSGSTGGSRAATSCARSSSCRSC